MHDLGINYNLSLEIENKFLKPFSKDFLLMSVLASRRKTLYELNAKIP